METSARKELYETYNQIRGGILKIVNIRILGCSSSEISAVLAIFTQSLQDQVYDRPGHEEAANFLKRNDVVFGFDEGNTPQVPCLDDDTQ
jgi:hypothetical protein